MPARITAPGEAEFTLWAPEANVVDLLLEDGAVLPMQPGDDGTFMLNTIAAPGITYLYRINGEAEVPDPASNAQSGDVHGPSILVDHNYPWQHETWSGRPWAETIIYELHPGACGGFAGVTGQLPRLAALGFTAIELMPIADFPGRHNWGYDGVLPYAPASAYGKPRDLKTLIDTAHGLGMQVFLDVVYNHFGPDGNYLNTYAASFFRADQHTPWGNAIDFRRPQVRDFFIGNAIYWLRDYRFDGLRFDAVHAIDDSNFLDQMAREIRAALPHRHIHLVLENENNDAERLTPETYNAQWADDWHHCAHVLLTGESEGYYEDFHAPAEQMARCLAEGFAYQGDPSRHHGNTPRGTPSTHLPTTAFVICLQNHDQIGNRAMGDRLQTLAHPEALRAAIALLLFTPQIPMVFMGEEFGETRPFLFFTDFNPELGRLVTAGRRREFAHFEAFSHPETREKIPDPNAATTFDASVPQVTENAWTALYRDCLNIRHTQIIPRLAGCTSHGAMALSPNAILAAWRMNDASLLTVVTNFSNEPVAIPPIEGAQLYGPPSHFRQLPGHATCLWLTP